MKKTDLTALALLLAMLASCSGEEIGTQGYGTIRFSIGNVAGTRSDTYSEDYESAVHNLQIIVADENGDIESLNEFSDGDRFDIPAKPGHKTVLAIANGPSFQGYGSIDRILDTEIGLTEWNSAAEGFIMSATTQCDVAVDSISALPMQLERYASRVRFSYIINWLPEEYGSLTFTGVWLANAVSSQNIAGDAPEETRLPIIPGTEDCQEIGRYLVYWPDTNMYCYPNGTASDTYIVIATIIRGEDYYYPIKLPQLERNTTYDVTLTVYHPGSPDPDHPVSPANISVKVTSGLWTEGPEITENL